MINAFRICDVFAEVVRVPVMAKILGTGTISSENQGNMNGLRSWLWEQSDSLAMTYSSSLSIPSVQEVNLGTWFNDPRR